MAESLIISKTDDRTAIYKELIPQIEALLSTEIDVTANLANTSAALKEALGFFWVGFYLVKGDELVLGPFQGSLACTRIKFGKGVCGTAWKEKRSIVVEDVDQFPGHIACSTFSKSEIVVPGFKNDEVCIVLDVDSDKLADFNHNDKIALEQLMRIIEKKI